MPFFLLGKSPDGTLHLLTPSAFSTRAQALAEASRVTAEPGFDRWDDEILAIDLDAGTPVLLVRPAAVAAPEPEPEPTPEPESTSEPEVELAPESPAEPEFEPVPAPMAEPDLTPEPMPEPESLVAEPSEIADVVDDSASDAIAAVISDLSDDSEAAFVSEVDAEEQPAEGVSLKDALQRTTVQLEAEGIVAPESVGPEVTGAVDEPDDTAEDAAPPAWPWDTAAQDKAFDLDALESPGEDEGSLVRAPGDDETMSVSRPVIMGSYSEAPAADEEPVAPTPTPQPDLVDDLLPSPAGVSIAAPAEQPASSSDFVDLPPAAVAPPLDSLSCEDCVYAETCPNKGQLDPASCGSFQWK